MESIEESYNSTTQAVRSNPTGYATAQALQIRLDPTPLLENLEMFLTGTKVIIAQDAKGRMVRKSIKTGTAMANERGVHAILNRVATVINPHVVQGNFLMDGPKQSSLFETFVTQFHENLATDLMTNLQNWGVSEEDYHHVINTVINLVIPFMTRLVDNKERQSYGESMVYESHDRQTGKPGGGMSIFQRR